MPECPACHSDNPVGARYCNQCASALPAASAPEEQPSTLPAPPPSDAAPNTATGNFGFSKLLARWVATDWTDWAAKISFALVACMLILLIVIAFAPSRTASDYPKSYDEAVAKHKDSLPPPSPPVTPINRTPAEHLDRARSYLADPQRQYDLDQARAELEQIPKGDFYYPEARTLLAKLASGKIRLPSEFERSHAAAIDTLRQVGLEVTYGKLKKNADRFVGQAWAFTGKVLEIHEQGSTTTARIGIGGYGLDAIYVECRCTTEFVEGNAVFVVGKVQGNYTYDTVAGWTLTIPQVNAVAIVTPGDGAKLRAAAQRR